MRYILRHITQLHLLTVILLSVGAMCMWFPAFLHEQHWWLVTITFCLTLINTVGLMYLNYHGTMTKMFDLFSGFTYLILCSAIIPLQTMWQAQLLTLICLLAVLVFQQIDRHKIETTAEHAFLMAILIGIASYWLPSLLLVWVPIILLLMYRQCFDGQSLIAILLGSAVVALYAALMVWAGWIAPTWLSFFDGATALRWLSIGAVLLATIINWICYSGEAIWRGLTFIGYVLVCISAWIVWLVLGTV